MGNFNSKVGAQADTNEKESVGKYSLRTRNERGNRLVNFCISNGFRVMNTAFPLPPRRLFTWTSSLDGSRHQIDYILIKKEQSPIIRGVKTLPGSDCGSDHELLIADIKLKLKSRKKASIPRKYDCTNIPHIYKVEIKNRFKELLAI